MLESLSFALWPALAGLFYWLGRKHGRSTASREELDEAYRAGRSLKHRQVRTLAMQVQRLRRANRRLRQMVTQSTQEEKHEQR